MKLTLSFCRLIWKCSSYGSVSDLTMNATMDLRALTSLEGVVREVRDKLAIPRKRWVLLILRQELHWHKKRQKRHKTPCKKFNPLSSSKQLLGLKTGRVRRHSGFYWALQKESYRSQRDAFSISRSPQGSPFATHKTRMQKSGIGFPPEEMP